MTRLLERDARIAHSGESSGERLTPPAPPHASTPAASVQLDAVTKRFPVRRGVKEMLRRAPVAPPVTVVDRVSFEVAPGEIFGLLGPNGAGKTTIFKMLSTLVIPDGGRACVGGFDVVRSPAEVRRVLSTVPADERSLNWRLTAVENVRLYAVLNGVPAAGLPARAASVLDLVGLSAGPRQLVATFSSGMRQRLMIARALISRPRVLLLDEPTRSLDPLSAQALRQFIRDELVARQGCTVVLATHDSDEAFRLCDRVVVLNRGRVLTSGVASEIARRFSDERVVIVTRDPRHPAWTALEQRGVLRRLMATPAPEEEWMRLACELPGDSEQRAQVLAHLVASGVRVAGLDREDSSLAALMSRLIDEARVGDDA
ncbi:MAG TPA: ABC transporter ATP-binding protein [Gemmatimonadaceae bacterium]|nr:ABC transporter ATP-binding protein [Gemmatimonadaceae bacterium]